ncbi:hypothetical protein CLAFUW4_05189 [Fulvia fulva]|uniref:Uncharacterized protein n=1 Tax=Passalora fulva TaxID=5499 RepID=A0A9Q8PI60_PASFU|nr:uncharacterized protein CLAFUR5_11717 [Fulvia fulva]KAK4626569.1 hypothetical protein CLAFUR4_05175 [Fulvia fulva]KAK4627896.1 hypothetical protein CLAFUR0_05181 [Fulvia fulva]UJO22850.1 hypothetical protein CLAFUR5_11717 [Fulvia fulva]WPV13964.1 hypothetical protein CLAFUW4_05189 [Fulvia fulva]WPV28462.1 hypothetical protein CLAFUW7_05185 [Fulvia fulva]
MAPAYVTILLYSTLQDFAHIMSLQTDRLLLKDQLPTLEDNRRKHVISCDRCSLTDRCEQDDAHSTSWYRRLAILLSATCILLGLSVLYLYHQISECSLDEGFAKGMSTELPAAKAAIQLTKHRFTGGLYFDENGRVYRHMFKGQPQYVGIPSPAIDDAWAQLIPGLYENLVGSEAAFVAGRTWQDPDGRYMIGLEVMHTLHCVNFIRKALDVDYYGGNGTAHSHRLHTDHCIDHIRQFVQCHADLTPLTFSWSDEKDNIVADWDALHTCRNFSKIQEWAVDRIRTQPIPHHGG